MKNQFLYALLLSIIFTAIAAFGILSSFDKWAQDSLFQGTKYTDNDIVVFGIDEKALKEIGAYNTWDRNVMASILTTLNSDPDNKPAVVAVDTLYSGKTDDAADLNLVEAAKNLDNVISAASATFSSGWYETSNGDMKWSNYRIINYEEPFKELMEVTDTGHINAMYDTDGIMRHALLYIEKDGEKTYSMPFEAAKKYLEKKGKKAKLPKTNSKGQFYVTYSSEPGNYYDMSVADLINDKVPADYYKDKIVLIGPYAAGLQDAYYTSIERSKAMYGVEFQANVIQQILDENYKDEVRDLPQLIALFIICFICAFVFFNWKVTRSLIMAVGISVICFFGTYLLYNKGFVLHLVWIPVSVMIIYMISIAINYIRESVAKQQITRTFERYVAPEIVKDILEKGTENLSLGGKTCEIAVLFVDVRGFTTMSERLDPEKVVFILNKYLTMASGCVEENKGTLDKFVGDAMMAFWGAPIEQEDAVYLAVKTAKGIVDGAARVSEELKEEIGEELRVGVGVHYGKAVVGNMGAERHMDYTAIGDTVNTAARLEANAPGGTVYISRAVVDALGDRITATSLGDSVKLKGKADGFEVLKLETIE